MLGTLAPRPIYLKKKCLFAQNIIVLNFILIKDILNVYLNLREKIVYLHIHGEEKKKTEIELIQKTKHKIVYTVPF